MKNQKLIIDSHVQLGTCPDTSLFAEELIERMDNSGQNMSVVFPMMKGIEFGSAKFNYYAGNDYIAEVQKRYPDRIIGIAGIDPRFQFNNLFKDRVRLLKHKVINASLIEIERAILTLNLRGIRLHPFLHNFPINDPIIMPPILTKLLECQNKIGKKLYNVIHACGDSVQNTPEKIAWVAKEFPELLFSLSHMGFGWGQDRYLDVLMQHKNLILDFTYGPNIDVLKKSLQKVGKDRIVAGSNEPIGNFKDKMLIVNQAIENESDKEMVLGGTIAKILGIVEKS